MPERRRARTEHRLNALLEHGDVASRDALAVSWFAFDVHERVQKGGEDPEGALLDDVYGFVPQDDGHVAMVPMHRMDEDRIPDGASLRVIEDSGTKQGRWLPDDEHGVNRHRDIFCDVPSDLYRVQLGLPAEDEGYEGQCRAQDCQQSYFDHVHPPTSIVPYMAALVKCSESC